MIKYCHVLVLFTNQIFPFIKLRHYIIWIYILALTKNFTKLVLNPSPIVLKTLIFLELFFSPLTNKQKHNNKNTKLYTKLYMCMFQKPLLTTTANGMPKNTTFLVMHLWNTVTAETHFGSIYQSRRVNISTYLNVIENYPRDERPLGDDGPALLRKTCGNLLSFRWW